MRLLTSTLINCRCGIDVGAAFGQKLKAVHFAFGGGDGAGLLFTNFAFADLIETQVGDDAVEPSAETTVEAETRQVAVDTKKRLLINVPRVFFGAEKIEGHTEDIAVVRSDELFKSVAVPVLRGANQGRFVHPLSGAVYPYYVVDNSSLSLHYCDGRATRRLVTPDFALGFGSQALACQLQFDQPFSRIERGNPEGAYLPGVGSLATRIGAAAATALFPFGRQHGT